jgi:hypothetical protein
VVAAALGGMVALLCLSKKAARYREGMPRLHGFCPLELAYIIDSKLFIPMILMNLVGLESQL